MSVAKRIKEAREANALTQEQLAKLLGVTKSAVGNYEMGLSNPKESVLYRMIEVLHCDANYFYQDGIQVTLKNSPLSLQEQEFIKYYRKLDEPQKNVIEQMMHMLVKEYPDGYDEKLGCFTDAKGARLYLNERQMLDFAFSGSIANDDEICEMATKVFQNLT